jgi:hypothetical protein
MARVHIRKETTDPNAPPSGWRLWFQWCLYELDDGDQYYGYRFIWRTKEGALQAARGQARIPSIKAAQELMQRATDEGWGDRDGDALEAAVERLEKSGCVITLASGYVGWPNKEAALKGHLTPEMIEDERIVREWS